MSQHAFVTRTNISLGVGFVAPTFRPLLGWTRKLDMWHPNLPEVRVSNAATEPRIFTLQPLATRHPNWPWNRVEVEPRAIPFWHPALPEVVIMRGTEHVPSGVYSLTTRADEPGRRFAAFFRGFTTAVALLLALAAPSFAAPAPCVVNVQMCNVAQCALLPGIGMAKGAAIAQAHPKNEQELDSVKGIGPATLEDIRPFVVYQGETTCTSKQSGKDGAR